MKIFAAIIISTVVVFSSLPQSVTAISEEDSEAIDQNTFFYDPEDVLTDCGDTTLLGESNAEITWNSFRARGLSETQVAGFMGNIQSLSNFSPTELNSSDSEEWEQQGFGIIQWLNTRKTRLYEYAEATEKDVTSLDYQLDFIWYELSGQPERLDNIGTTPGVLADIQDATTIEDAVTAVDAYVSALLSTEDSVDIDVRTAYAENWFGQFTGIDSPTIGSCAGAGTGVGDGAVGGVGVSPDGFVFPIASRQRSVSWCGGSLGNCHGRTWAGPYYAYDIWESMGGGATIVAVKDGTIRRFNPDYRCRDPQLSFWLQDEENVWHFYQHLDAARLEPGVGTNVRVSAGQKLGVIGPNAYVGGTCRNTSPHLHFASAIGGRTNMSRNCSQSRCPDADRLTDMAPVLRSAYANLPE